MEAGGGLWTCLSQSGCKPAWDTLTGLWSTFLGGEDRGASHYICQKETLLMMTSYKSHLFLVQKLENTYTQSKRREMTIIPAPGDYQG